MMENKISKTRVKGLAEIGLLSRAPFSNLKYDVVVPALIFRTADFSRQLQIHSRKLEPKLNFFKTAIKSNDLISQKLFQYLFFISVYNV